MNCIQNHPAFHGRNVFKVPFQQLDIKRQVQVLVDVLGDEHLVRNKVVSTKTQSDRFLLACKIFRLLAEENLKPRSVLGLGQKHVEVLAIKWRDQGLLPATIQTYFSHLRWFAAAIGKPGLIRDPSYYGLTPEHVSRTYASVVDKSWTSRGVLPQVVIARIQQKDALVAVQFRLMYEFGLRVREAILIRPLISHVGSLLRIEEGTKGGRSRVLAITEPSQWEAIELAKEASRGCRRGTLVPSGSTYEAAMNRFYYICKMFGITKAGLGVTSHGLRHQYANDLYESVSGQASTVRGGTSIMDEARDKLARRAVTQDLGHSRTSVTAAYTGPINAGRFKSRQIKVTPVPRGHEC